MNEFIDSVILQIPSHLSLKDRIRIHAPLIRYPATTVSLLREWWEKDKKTPTLRARDRTNEEEDILCLFLCQVLCFFSNEQCSDTSSSTFTHNFAEHVLPCLLERISSPFLSASSNELIEAVLEATIDYPSRLDTDLLLEIYRDKQTDLPMSILSGLPSSSQRTRVLLQAALNKTATTTSLDDLVQYILPALSSESIPLSFLTQVLEQSNAVWTSAILCVLLPRMLEDHEPEIVNLEALWSFIQESLQPQLFPYRDKVLSHQSSLSYSAKPHASLVRRRALYLLRLITAHREKWKKFVSCLETIEMENEGHLIDQIWKTVRELCINLTNTSKNQNDDKSLTWEWMELLFARAVTSHDRPVIRKQVLCQFLEGKTGIAVHPEHKGFPLSQIPPNFVLTILLPSFDSLESSVGLNYHQQEKGKTVVRNIPALLASFLDAYLNSLENDDSRMIQQRQNLLKGLFGPQLVGTVRRSTLAQTYETVAAYCKSRQRKERIIVESDLIPIMAKTLSHLMNPSGTNKRLRTKILEYVAVILGQLKINGSLSPLTILEILSNYPMPLKEEYEDYEYEGKSEISYPWIHSLDRFKNLANWVHGLLTDGPGLPKNVGSTLATALVDGVLPDSGTPPGASLSLGMVSRVDPVARAIVFLTTMTASLGEESISASEQLWPAVHKGLRLIPEVRISKDVSSKEKIYRALSLLENGVSLEIVSGLGNGDLVVDKKTQQMLPPPPNIERMLHDSAGIIIDELRQLMASTNCESVSQERALSKDFFTGVRLLRSLYAAFPSSTGLTSSVEALVEKSTDMLLETPQNSEDGTLIDNLLILFSGVSLGMQMSQSRGLQLLKSLVVMNVSHSPRSTLALLHYSRWYCISLILPQIVTAETADPKKIVPVFEEVLDAAISAVSLTFEDSVMPVFRALIETSGLLVTQETVNRNMILCRTTSALLDLLTEARDSDELMRMLDKMSSFLFNSSLLLSEARQVSVDPAMETPIKDTFRKLIAMSTMRPHISRTILAHISFNWLGTDFSGAPAVQYKDDILKLLVSKQPELDDASAMQGSFESKETNILQIPSSTNETSVSRTFVLVFLSRIQPSKEVLVDLIHPLFLQLLEIVQKKLPGNKIPMKGTEEYCAKMRAWQALCVLSRFISTIDDQVAEIAFMALSEHTHGPIRKFNEIFLLQCTRIRPVCFGKVLCREIIRTNLTIQQATSLMIIFGNLVVGRYREDFSSALQSEDISVEQAAVGLIPWLASTQGFSRTISQLLLHQLIPVVLQSNSETRDQNVLRSVFSFLEQNEDMKRVRRRQMKFFENYDVDKYCTPEGIAEIPVDDANEASPELAVDAIKDCLQEVHNEIEAESKSIWKKLDEIDQSQEEIYLNGQVIHDDVGFQRKIIPLDALNLTLRSAQESRLQNGIGRRRQDLIVCASLIDKVPNLGGLARTSEIFAAEKLIIPDKTVAKMDNFTSISVGAAEWIEIEECKEEVSKSSRKTGLEGMFAREKKS